MQHQKQFPYGAVGDVLTRHWQAVDDDFNRHFARGTDARSFEIPVRLPVIAASANVSFGCSPDAPLLLLSRYRLLLKFDFAALSARQQSIDAKVQQVALAIRDVRAPIAQPIDPGIKVELCIKLDITAAETNTIAIYAWEISLTTDAGAKTDIERVIPDIELPDIGCVDRRDEVTASCVTSTTYSLAPMPS